MALTKADIIRQASLLLGKSQINQTASGGPAGSALEDTYNRLVPALLEADDWRFSTATLALNRLEHTPNITKWRYVYQMPANTLRLNHLIPNTNLYDIQENYIYCNSPTLSGEFRFRVDESKFSATFVDFLVYKLAAEAAPILSIQPNLISWLASESDKKYLKALAANGQAIPPREIIDSPFIEAGYW